VTEPKQLIGVAMLIDKVFFGPQDRVVVQEPIQHACMLGSSKPQCATVLLVY
jgi:hypothetical protein